MKNFLRALRVSWSYRGRLILSLACALVVVFFWGMMFTAISRALNILGGKHRNLQEFCQSSIHELQDKIAKLNMDRKEPEDEAQKLAAAAPSLFRDKRMREVTLRLA